MRDDQFDDGRIPHVIPDMLDNRGGSPGWMDAATIIPWEVYVRTGDAEVLAENYEMMEADRRLVPEQSKDGLIPKIDGFGDWLQPYAADNKGDTPKAAARHGLLCAQRADSGRSARVLGKDSGCRRSMATKLLRSERPSRNTISMRDGRLQNAPETQTAYMLAIAFDLIPAELQEQGRGAFGSVDRRGGRPFAHRLSGNAIHRPGA